MAWDELSFTNLLIADFSGNNFKAPGRFSIMPAFALLHCTWDINNGGQVVGSEISYPDISAAVWNIDIVSGDTAVSLSRATPPQYYDEEIDGRYYKTTGVSRTVELGPDLVVGKITKETTLIVGMTLGTLYAETAITLLKNSTDTRYRGLYPLNRPSVFTGYRGMTLL